MILRLYTRKTLWICWITLVPILYMNILLTLWKVPFLKAGGVRFTCINLDCQYLACVPLVSSRADQRLTHQTKWRPTLRFDLTTVILQNIVFSMSHGAVPSGHAPWSWSDHLHVVVHTLIFSRRLRRRLSAPSHLVLVSNHLINKRGRGRGRGERAPERASLQYL